MVKHAYPALGYGFCWGTESATRTRTWAKTRTKPGRLGQPVTITTQHSLASQGPSTVLGRHVILVCITRAMSVAFSSSIECCCIDSKSLSFLNFISLLVGTNVLSRKFTLFHCATEISTNITWMPCTQVICLLRYRLLQCKLLVKLYHY